MTNRCEEFRCLNHWFGIWLHFHNSLHSTKSFIWVTLPEYKIYRSNLIWNTGILLTVLTSQSYFDKTLHFVQCTLSFLSLSLLQMGLNWYPAFSIQEHKRVCHIWYIKTLKTVHTLYNIISVSLGHQCIWDGILEHHFNNRLLSSLLHAIHQGGGIHGEAQRHMDIPNQEKQ